MDETDDSDLAGSWCYQMSTVMTASIRVTEVKFKFVLVRDTGQMPVLKINKC